MTNLTEEQMKEAQQRKDESVEIAQHIISFLEGMGVENRLGISALGIAFGAGAYDLGMPLPIAIDIVRAIYTHAQTAQKVH